MHRMWSVWLLLFGCALDAAYANLYVLREMVSPIHFIELNIAANVLIGAIRVINQRDVPNA